MKKQHWFIIALVVVVAGLVWLRPGHRSPALPGAAGGPDATPAAAVVPVVRTNLFREITIPAEFRPYVEAELNAKVAGYVDRMNVDFGDKVKAGELLATIEVPELQDQLDNSLATKQKAEADYTNADLIYTRLTAVNREHPDLVAQQDLDTAAANDHAAAAAIAAAQADVEKYQTLTGYTNITAPFDGVVTRRYADPGQLIQAGTASDSQARALVRVSDNYLLRLDFPVTVDYVQYIQTNAPVEVRVDSLGGKSFTGRITRFTDDVNDSTRTMITEIEVPNPDLELVPGMYATAILKVEQRPHALAIPIQAVSEGDLSTGSSVKTATVMIVNAAHQIEERTVQLGLRTPDQYEVLSGLNEGDLVVIGSRLLFQPGETVTPKPAGLPAVSEN